GEAGQRLAADIQDFLSSLASEVRIRRFSGDRLFLNLACLVPRDDTEVFRRRVQTLWRDFPQLHFLLTGPWPPYHFISGETHDTANLLGF
ncbi:MAG: GvpL/GvpF family gas vesicle protein, partial [Elusimicrobia bacterium]|nr:GvpL/GvpF family gas vesicle protein [Elusimicrobiota bacterium]